MMKLQDRLTKTLSDAQAVKSDVLGHDSKWIEFKELNPEFITFLASIALLVIGLFTGYKLLFFASWVMGVSSCFRGKVSL